MISSAMPPRDRDQGNCLIQLFSKTIKISANAIGALAALFLSTYSVQLQSDRVVEELAVIGHL